MSIEKALLGKARPYMPVAKAKAIVRQEVSKSCLPLRPRGLGENPHR